MAFQKVLMLILSLIFFAFSFFFIELKTQYKSNDKLEVNQLSFAFKNHFIFDNNSILINDAKIKLNELNEKNHPERNHSNSYFYQNSDAYLSIYHTFRHISNTAPLYYPAKLEEIRYLINAKASKNDIFPLINYVANHGFYDQKLMSDLINILIVGYSRVTFKDSLKNKIVEYLKAPMDYRAWRSIKATASTVLPANNELAQIIANHPATYR